MKIKLIIFGLAVVLALSLLACSAAEPGNVSREVPIDNFMNQHNQSDRISVPVGGVLTLTLGSNLTTGFQWSSEAEIGDGTIIRQAGHEYYDPESDTPPPPGASGHEVWTFKAEKPGTTTIYLEYSRPWEGGEKAEWTYTLTVTVK